MMTTFRGRFRNGVIEPLESVNIPENVVLTVTAAALPTDDGDGGFGAGLGAWADLVDCDALIRDIYQRRLADPRAPVSL